MSQASSLYAPYSIAGQVALITGASSGIGEAIAWRFAEAGCRLVLLARRADRLEALAAALRKRYGAAVHEVALDVRAIERLAGLPEELPPEFRDVDILVNNAGLALGVAPVQENDLEDLRCMVDTNFSSVVALTRAFTPGECMIARKRGHVIIMSSIAGQEAYSGGSMYCATKHAVRAFADAARHDLVGTAVRVTTISPGAVKTEFSSVRFKVGGGEQGDQDKADAVYEGFDSLQAADIADNAIYAATRPPHVCDITVFATNQCSAKGLARVKLQ
eukprot:scaffold3.g6395.t1